MCRSADCVVGGFRYNEGKPVVGSLLLGLYGEDGLLHHVGFTSTIRSRHKKELTRKLERFTAPPGFTGSAPGGPSRWSTDRSGQWEPLKPKLVVEVRYDHFSGHRFRHGTKFLRWRPDKSPRQCTMDQVVERTVELDASPDDVWRALTEPGELAAWFGPEAELDVQPGGRGRFVDDEGVVRRAVVDQVRPGERLVLRWWPEGDGPGAGAGASVVTFVVAPSRGGSRLVVTERLDATPIEPTIPLLVLTADRLRLGLVGPASAALPGRQAHGLDRVPLLPPN